MKPTFGQSRSSGANLPAGEAGIKNSNLRLKPVLSEVERSAGEPCTRRCGASQPRHFPIGGVF